MCLYCVLVLLFGVGHLIGSWFLTAQGYMLDWLGNVTSTVSSFQLSGGVCVTQQIYMHILYISYGPIVHMTAWNLLHLYCFVHVLFHLHFMYKFSHPLESVYWFHRAIFPSHIVFPHLCWVWFDFCVGTVNSVLHFVQSPVQCSVPGIVSLCWTGYIKAEILGTDQIWQSYKRKPWHFRGKPWYL